MAQKDYASSRLLTVGHGTLTQDAFLDLVRAAGVQAVVDVRRFPGSRRHPHFARPAMEQWLAAGGVAYRHEEALGGRRASRPGSVNAGLRNAAFRGYADHMATADFAAALRRVAGEAGTARTAVLCAESVWWRCHRRLVADAAVLLHALRVEHLFHDGRLQGHPVTAGAVVRDAAVVYPEPEPPLPGL